LIFKNRFDILSKKHRKGKFLANSKSKHKRMQHRFRLKGKKKQEKRKLETAAPVSQPEAPKA